ncbi:hypothetical protein BGX38DRAFT_1331876 [Terfezia claveryi]|nr:hypothetical protein BGX38DRAFT_1331876 [Terfezia claveryi]
MSKLKGAFAIILDRKKPTYMRVPYLSRQRERLIPEQQSMERFKNAGVSGNGHIPFMHETVKTIPGELVLFAWAKEKGWRW